MPDLSRFGEIVNEPPFLFPHNPESNGLPLPTFPDPLGLGDKAVAALGMFSYVDGRRAGQKITPDTLMPFQIAIIKALFGHVDPDTMTRYISFLFLLIPRKNSKSFIAAITALLEMISCREPNGEIVMVAKTTKQARIIFKQVKSILETAPELARHCRLRDRDGIIEYQAPTGQRSSIALAASQDPSSLHGMSVTTAIIDEVHALQGTKGVEIYNALTTSQGARRNPRILVLTTQSDNPRALQKGELFETLTTQMTDVASGKRKDPRALPVMLVPDQSDDWRSEDTWLKVNPAIAGGMLDINEFRQEYKRTEGSHLLESGFRCLRLNYPPENLGSTTWMAEHIIERNTAKIEWSTFKQCDRVFIGVDLAVTDDWTSATAVGFKDDKIICRGLHYVCGESFSQHISEDIRWQSLVDSGDLIVVSGDGIDLTSVAADIMDLWPQVSDKEQPIIAMDPALGQSITTVLEESYQADVFHVRQGAISLTPAIIEAEGALTQNRITLHPGCLPYAFGNAVKERRGESMMLSRDATRTPRKIDPVIAVMVAVALDLSGEAGTAAFDVAAWIG